MRRRVSVPLLGTVSSSKETMVGSDTPQRASTFAYSFPGGHQHRYYKIVRNMMQGSVLTQAGEESFRLIHCPTEGVVEE